MTQVRDDTLVGIGEVARRFGVQPSTLRYYDEFGLLAPAARRAGRRYYGQQELRRLVLIQLYATTGLMSLGQVKEILEGTSSFAGGFRAVAHEHVARLTELIERAERARSTLEHHLACSRDDPSRCPSLEEELQERVDAALVDFKDT